MYLCNSLKDMNVAISSRVRVK